MAQMTLNEYQKIAVSTAIYREQGTLLGKMYCALKMNGEAGEVAEKVAKALRDNNGHFTLDRKDAIAQEMGDVLWYIAALAREFDFSLEHIAMLNIEKLKKRKENNTLHGDGDNR